jgi:hypothetical protein
MRPIARVTGQRVGANKPAWGQHIHVRTWFKHRQVMAIGIG